MVLIAKPVVANQYWILQNNNRKVGNIEATGDGYSVKIDNQTSYFKTISMVKQRANVEFESIDLTPSRDNSVLGFPATSRTYNSVWDVKHRLPLFTKKLKSKSWYAAGWYRVEQHGVSRTVQNPKLILLQRYQYQGPFKSQSEAEQ